MPQGHLVHVNECFVKDNWYFQQAFLKNFQQAELKHIVLGAKKYTFLSKNTQIQTEHISEQVFLIFYLKHTLTYILKKGQSLIFQQYMDLRSLDKKGLNMSYNMTHQGLHRIRVKQMKSLKKSSLSQKNEIIEKITNKFYMFTTLLHQCFLIFIFN